MFFSCGRILALPLLLFSVSIAAAQGKPSPAEVSEGARKAIALGQSGHCENALPLLRKEAHRVADKDLKLKASLTGLRCAMTLDRSDAALDFLQTLVHDFPKDPGALYSEVHAFSDLATRSSQLLGMNAPGSPEARELLAESYESQGKWDDAEKEYRTILEHDPNFPGIHFRLGRLLLSKPNPPATAPDDAKREFEQELAANPSNAGAEYVLGELARQNQQWDDAVAHFSRASKLDAHFAEAFLGLGISLISLKRYADAVPPLETATRLEPMNPNAHYNLATAYTRSGRKNEAAKEFAMHEKLIGTQGGSVDHAKPPDQANQ